MADVGESFSSESLPLVGIDHSRDSATQVSIDSSLGDELVTKLTSSSVVGDVCYDDATPWDRNRGLSEFALKKAQAHLVSQSDFGNVWSWLRPVLWHADELVSGSSI